MKKELTQIPQSFTISAPGKLILFGEHAVVYGKKALASSLSDIRTFIKVKVEPKQNNNEKTYFSIKAPVIKIFNNISIDLNYLYSLVKNLILNEENKEIKTPNKKIISILIEYLNKLNTNQQKNDLYFNQTKKTSLIACLYLLLAINEKNKDKNDNLSSILNNYSKISFFISSDVPIGSGLGSSAAFAVCLSTTFLILSNLIDIKNQLKINYKNQFCLKFGEKEKQLINSWSFLVEKLIHGTPSGIDNTVSSFGGVISMNKDENGKIIINSIKEKNIPQQLRIMIVNTKKEKNTKKLVGIVKMKRDKNPEIINPILDKIEKISDTCLSLFKKMSNEKDSCFHNNNNFIDLSKLVIQNHEFLNELGVGDEKLDLIVKTAKQFKFSGKLTGAGGGGCGFILISSDAKLENIESLKKKLLSFNFEIYESSQVGKNGVLFHFNE